MQARQARQYAHVSMQQGPDEKTFLKDQLQLTGMEISWTEFASGESSSFLHSHQQNEELYICTQGQGEIQVDGEILEFVPGIFIKVSPEGKRAIRNIGTEPLRYLCIQARERSLNQWTRDDGIRYEAPLWPAQE